MDITQFLSWTQLELPSRAQNIQFETLAGGIDDLGWLVFDMPTEQVDGWLQNLGLAQPLRAKYRPFPDEAEAPNWWNPYSTDEYLGARFITSMLGREIMVHMLSEDWCRVHLRTYEL